MNRRRDACPTATGAGWNLRLTCIRGFCSYLYCQTMRVVLPIIGMILAAWVPSRALAKLESAEVTLEYVAKKAEQRAHKPFRSPREELPDVLRADKLDYDK